VALKGHSNKWKYGAANSGFPHTKQFLQKLSATWACSLKNVCQVRYRLKKLKEYQFEGVPHL
jgi:hypothetical protein